MAPPLQKFPLGIRLMLMFGMLLINVLIISIVVVHLLPLLFGIQPETLLAGGIPQTFKEVEAFLFAQVFTLQGAFLLTAIMFSKLEAKRARERLKINVFPPIKMILLAVISILISQFFIEFLVDLNGKIPLPHILNFLKDIDKQNEGFLNAITNFKQPGQFVIISLFIALAPALCEEMFFRGLFLGALLRTKMAPWVAIFISGFVFALSHMEYSNTIAICALGAFLGYLYYISGSIWLSVAAHFTNNFLAVLFKYLYNTGVISKDIADASMPVYITILSIVLFVGCIYIFNKWKKPVSFESIVTETTAPPDWSV